MIPGTSIPRRGRSWHGFKNSPGWAADFPHSHAEMRCSGSASRPIPPTSPTLCDPQPGKGLPSLPSGRLPPPTVWHFGTESNSACQVSRGRPMGHPNAPGNAQRPLAATNSPTFRTKTGDRLARSGMVGGGSNGQSRPDARAARTGPAIPPPGLPIRHQLNFGPPGRATSTVSLDGLGAGILWGNPPPPALLSSTRWVSSLRECTSSPQDATPRILPPGEWCTGTRLGRSAFRLGRDQRSDCTQPDEVMGRSLYSGPHVVPPHPPYRVMTASASGFGMNRVASGPRKREEQGKTGECPSISAQAPTGRPKRSHLRSFHPAPHRGFTVRVPAPRRSPVPGLSVWIKTAGWNGSIDGDPQNTGSQVFHAPGGASP